MIDKNSQLESPRYHVLVAEDNPADVGLVREAFATHHVACALHVVSDGAQAIAFINRLDASPGAAQLDLVLLDMYLPKHDGEEILGCLRSTQKYARVPVILMTGADYAVVERKAGKPAGLSYFRKPSSLDEFLQLGLLVRRILNRETEPIAPSMQSKGVPGKAGALGAA